MQFRTKARAVDLLGKGQIADLPTAITELWKNGYDAYADNLTAQIFLKGYKNLSSSFFMMTDDGKGMSKSDILEKWLVLGTDSKSRINNQDKEGPETLWKKPRIKAGEKGIGRLSVAYLGNPMLMLTKKIGHPLQGLFFDWRLLENYNFFLEDVQLPVIDIENTENFRQDFDFLINEFLLNFETTNSLEGKPIWENEQMQLKANIISSVKNIEIPAFFENEILKDIITTKSGHGTKFIIFEPEEQILNLVLEKRESNDSEFVRSSLAGFTNPFKEKKLEIQTKFPIHSEIGFDYDFLTSKGNFFTPEDFQLADILIDGNFDGNGEFKGKIKIYDKEIDYAFISPRRLNNKSNYGPFPIKLGYVQGNLKDSKLEEGNWRKIGEKLKSYGALYIYRDDFRVLPYGRPDHDFLNFEKRRAERAGTYYFSHVRMFGYIALERSINDSLRDKSSREGLINNAPYRAFREDLVSFFKELANEYFSSEAKQTIFLDEKNKLNAQAQALEEDKKRTTKEKVQFSKDLKNYPELLKKYKEQYRDLLFQLEEKLDQDQIVYYELESILKEIQKLDIGYKELLPRIPKTYKPTELQLDRLDKYENEVISFNETIKKDSKTLISHVRKRLEIKDLHIEFSNNTEEYKAFLEGIINKNRIKLRKKIQTLNDEYNRRSLSKINELQLQKNKILNSIQDKDDVIDGIQKMVVHFESLREQIEKEIIPLIEHIEKLDFDIDEDLLQGAYKDEYEKIKHQWEQTRETAQLGIAVEIIDHEFNVLYAQINSALSKLDGSIPTDQLSNYITLKSFFKSLEDKYALLSPLYRVSGANSKNIQCRAIYDYLKRFFEKQFEQEKINFKATDSFLHHIINIKEPVIHTVFINIINNAIFWLKKSEEKLILLDYIPETKEILILNSGQKIENHRLDKIFELFYSNRPNGRGIGLFLSKESLNENYFTIYASNDKSLNKLSGACFVITPLN